jgi:hypothetical protein
MASGAPKPKRNQTGRDGIDFFEQCKEGFLCPYNGAKFKAFLSLEKSPRNHEKVFEIGQRENLKQ